MAIRHDVLSSVDLCREPVSTTREDIPPVLRRTPLTFVLALCLGVLLCGGSPGMPVFPAPYAYASAAPQLMFAMGSEADGARATPLATQAPVKMLTSWYNGPGDLAWMSGWQHGEVPNDYAAGYALQLIVYSGQPHTAVSTPYGPACGQAYPLSAGFLSDMTRLAQIFQGSGPLYVS